MANLTLTIDDAVLRRARIKALEEGTSVNAIVRRQLEEYVAGAGPELALADFLDRARRSAARSSGGRTWTRDDLYTGRLPRS